MNYMQFEDLPDFLQDYIRDLVGDNAPDWVRQAIPALDGRSFLQLLNQEGIVPSAKYLTAVGTKFGLPHGVTIPNDFMREDA